LGRHLTLSDGREVDIWADAVTGISDKTAKDPDIVFGALMDIDIDQQDGFDVTARGTAPGRRVEVAVARFPRASVRDVRSA
jgi:hypothetical protein